MRKIRKIFCGIVTAAYCSLLTFGCAKENTVAPNELRNATVQLSVGSRVVNEADGTPANAESAVHTLRVYAFVGSRLAGHCFVDDVVTVPHSFYMDLTFYAMKQNVVFYAVANEAAMITAGSGGPARLTENTTEEQLNNFTFTQLSSNVAGVGLPMCCKVEQSLDFTSLSPEVPSDPDHAGHQLLNSKIELALQRPMGKLGVFAARRQGDAGVLRITGLKMLESGTRTLNYLMPQNVETLKKVTGIAGDFSLDVVSDPVNKELAEGITETERMNPANYSPVLASPFYPFENPWGSDVWSSKGDEFGNVLQIDYSIDGAARSGLVYLPKIVRNNYYTVCCLINNEGKITVEYTVADWDTKEKYELEFDYPTYDNPVLPFGGTDSGQVFDKPTVWYNNDETSKDGSYSFSFKITGPKGQTWMPTLFDSPGNFEVTVWQNGKKVEPEKDGGYGVSPEAYELRVRALSPEVSDGDGKPKSVGLGISYVPKWNPTESSLLLINGLTDKLRWAGSKYAETIVVEQVDRQ